MSATPRVRSGAYPQTPGTTARRAPSRGAPLTPSPSPSPAPASPSRRSASSRLSRSPLPLAPQGTGPSGAGNANPLIPTTIIDAPTQRFYVVAIYVALLAWRFYDWIGVVEDNTESLWLFLKWLAIDFVFLFGLPELRIPWLELAQPFVVGAFFCHAAFDFMLMYNIGLPWQAWILGIVRVFYDRELAISEHNVRVSSILHNSSLIMGRQVINILPEGSAVLNPEDLPFCLGVPDRKIALLPIVFNATIPVEVEVIRTDLETNKEEVLRLSGRHLREIETHAKRRHSDQETDLVNFEYAVKKPGAYRLGRVLDEYKLEVQRRTPPTLVVPCPKARVNPVVASSERCLGDLSDLTLEVEGTPPLKIVYSRTINGEDHSFHFQSLQPDGFQSPLLGSTSSTTLTLDGDEDVSWARSQRVTLGLNESMHVGGDWQYSIDEVQDVFGNVVRYAAPTDELEPKPKPKHLVQNFVVHSRPQIHLDRCDLQHPLRVASGRAVPLPVNFMLPGRRPVEDGYAVSWQFSPQGSLTKSGEHGDASSFETYRAKGPNDQPKVSAPGLYTLKSVSSGTCEGEVKEPSSCLLINPLEPKITIWSEEIPDTCAGNSIGRRFDLELVGTPPFVVRFDTIENGVTERQKLVIKGTRDQAEIVPKIAGNHKIIFTQIDDAVYKGVQLKGPEYVFEQTVRPPARAMIMSASESKSVCLEDEVEVDVMLFGEPPFTLEWELVHDGRRKRHKEADIQELVYKIKTAPLSQGGEYTLVLTGIQDKTGCRNFLQDEIKISVRRQRPRAAFAQIDNKRKTMIVEDSKVNLPLRLTGDGPWTVSYQNLNDGSAMQERTLRNTNDYIDVKARGVYEILDVSDRQCHGTVDPSASKFEVGWFARPELSLVRGDSVAEKDGRYVKQDVCEGDIDGFELSLKGVPPYHVDYEVRNAPPRGPGSLSRRAFDAALGKASVQMDTAKAGHYTYTFSALADALYNTNNKLEPLVVEQRVNARPSASFAKPGQTFKYCLAEGDSEETIPLTLTGVAPFYVEIEIKHQSGTIPETYRIPSINSNTYGLRIPRTHLKLGMQHVRIRNVRDARGCQQQKLATDGAMASGPSVQVQLYDAPSIYPLETRTDYCVGERIAYSLSGTPPFEVSYTFDGVARRARAPTTNFRRVAESPGEFTVTSVADKASECRAAVNISKMIHPLPAVRVSRGKDARVDIHEGGEVPILFEFFGTPPFEFTYTRSSNPAGSPNGRKGAGEASAGGAGKKSVVLETRHEISHEHSMVVRASQEGTYEVVAIKDRYCAFSTQANGGSGGSGKDGQKLLQF